MKKRFRLQVYVALIATLPLLSHAQSPTTQSAKPLIPGFVPAPVASGQAKLIRPIATSLPIRLTLVLKPPHREELAKLAADVSNSKSPAYRRFLTADQWKARFAPTDAQVEAVSKWARSSGLRETHRYRTNLAIVVDSDVATVQRVFAVHLNEYEHDQRRFFANDKAPTLPPQVVGLLDDVLGLNSFGMMRPHGATAVRLPDIPAPPTPSRQFGVQKQFKSNAKAAAPRRRRQLSPDITGPNPGFLEPPDLWSSQAYDFAALAKLSHCCNPTHNQGGTPKETSIALIDANSLQQSDVQTFFNTYGLAWNLTEIQLNGPNCCDSETTMDVEWAGAMANSFGSYQDTAALYVYEGGSWQYSDNYNAWLSALDEDRARVASMSGGESEDAISVNSGNNTTMNDFSAIFDSMIARGWTLVASSGDNGAYDDCSNLTVRYPASDPNFIAVGGTTLTLSGPPLQFVSETAWTGTGCPNNAGGGGGGCSAVFSPPWWQPPLACAAGQKPPPGSSSRAVPDLALNAYPDQAVYFQGAWVGSGGTSIAAPEIAGFLAQENSYLAFLKTRGVTCEPSRNQPCTPLGNPAQVFYRTAGTGNKDPFYDVTKGCNGGGPGIGYCANPGYDLATGWGSANMLQLAWAINNYLTGGSGTTLPSVSFKSPPALGWYTSDQSLKFDVGNPTIGIAGFTAQWDSDSGDPSSESGGGSGNPFWDGPQTLANSGALSLAAAGPGCHTAYVRAWDNNGLSDLPAPATYGPLCFCGSGAVAGVFGMSLSPTPLTIRAGSSNSLAVRTKLDACAKGAIDLSVTGLPSHVTAGPGNPTSVAAGGSIALQFLADYAAPSEQSTVTLTAKSNGYTHQETFTIQVIACVPRTCTSTQCTGCYDASTQTRFCGTISDGCGGDVTCPACLSGTSCVDHKCQATCVAKKCPQGACGYMDDGCGATICCGGRPGSRCCP
jgi:subtilase family serine protease